MFTFIYYTNTAVTIYIFPLIFLSFWYITIREIAFPSGRNSLKRIELMSNIYDRVSNFLEKVISKK